MFLITYSVTSVYNSSAELSNFWKEVGGSAQK